MSTLCSKRGSWLGQVWCLERESWHRIAYVLWQILSSKFLIHFSLFLPSQPTNLCVCVTFDFYTFKKQVNKCSVWKIELKKENWDFPGGPVVKTPHFQCRGHGFSPWWGNWDPTCHVVDPPPNNGMWKPSLTCSIELPDQIFGHKFKSYLLFIGSSDLTGHPVFLFVKSGNQTLERSSDIW